MREAKPAESGNCAYSNTSTEGSYSMCNYHMFVRSFVTYFYHFFLEEIEGLQTRHDFRLAEGLYTLRIYQTFSTGLYTLRVYQMFSRGLFTLHHYTLRNYQTFSQVGAHETSHT